ncbi:hypothetical protein GCK72_014292 [Caenorhabditis remanei]|uniref:Uncharacterized protein n=1 Tax=Caenorhabditis remanei TaxID=31234 RepID=A0A6A5GTM6_CAERE|nr:hypothetical protein GCK72_014292 [Caenorhabditis remanei]KAF1757835.1 hypothetical protein GCK72_014292 [Caenorhabditis remanei]
MLVELLPLRCIVQSSENQNKSSLAVEVSITSSSGPNTSGSPCIVYFDVSRLTSIKFETSSSWISGSENSWPNGEWAFVVDGNGTRFNGDCQKKDSDDELGEGHH